MIELLKVEVTNLPHIYERKIKEAVAMVRLVHPITRSFIHPFALLYTQIHALL